MVSTPAQRSRPSSGRVGRVPWLAAGALALLALGAAGCASPENDAERGTVSSTASSDTNQYDGGDPDSQLHPDVVEVELSELGDGRYAVSATLSSPYDSPERYADAWRVLDPDGTELGVRELAHDHAAEQPFTRSTTIVIPQDVAEVTVQGRDQKSGYGGETVTVQVPRNDP